MMDEKKMLDELSKRFDKVEDKLDKVSDALVHLARIDERQTNQSETINRVFKDIAKQDVKIADIEERVEEVELHAAEHKPIFGILRLLGSGAVGAILVKVAERLI